MKTPVEWYVQLRDELSRAEATIKDLETLVDRHLEQKAALNQDLQRFKAQRDLLDRALTSKNQTVAEQERRIEDLEAENARLREALEMIYDKWEDGVSCYEDPEEHTAFVGNAIQLSDEEEKQILALIPKQRTAALNPTKEARK